MRLQACVSTLQTFASFKFLNSVRMRTQIPLVDLGYLTRFGLQSCLRLTYASSSLLFRPGLQPWLQSRSCQLFHTSRIRWRVFWGVSGRGAPSREVPVGVSVRVSVGVSLRFLWADCVVALI